MMKTTLPQHSQLINRQASEWFTLMQSETISDQNRKQFQEWLAVSGEHFDAYQQLELIWSDLSVLGATADGDAIRHSISERSQFGGIKGLFEPLQNFLGGVSLALRMQFSVALLTLALVGVVLLQPQSIQVESYATATGEIKTITLADGSEITLGAESIMKTWHTDTERHVTLERGQAFFVVTKDPQRPFWVDADDTQVKVVGTQFDVRRSQGRVRVAVLEGVVKVTDRTPVKNEMTLPPAPVVLTAGQQVIKSHPDTFEAVATITAQELGSWRDGRLFYRNANLQDVIDDANRYFDGNITLATEDLALLKVTAALRTEKIAFLPQLLSESLPIIVHKTVGNHIVLAMAEVKK